MNDLGEQEDTEALLIEDKNKIFKGKISKGNFIEGIFLLMINMKKLRLIISSKKKGKIMKKVIHLIIIKMKKMMMKILKKLKKF